MAVPHLYMIEESANFSLTVEPFLPQLLDLPAQLSTVDSVGSLLQIYVETNPLVSGFSMSLAIAVITFFISTINRNWSQIDRLWSILPAFYAGHFSLWARLAGIQASRVHLAWAFTIIWSARLTYNYWRKGGYTIGSEDYRWPIVRRYLPTIVQIVFNLVFVSFIQSILLYALTVPIYSMLLTSKFEDKAMSGDIFFYVLELLLIFTEGIADQQQWDFQNAKQEYLKTAKVPTGFTQMELDRGFLASGLWAYSRHPNFACEQMIWFCLFQWSCFSSKTVFSWTGAGPIFLIMLFQGSTWLTELLSAQKYPEYVYYQRKVAMFIPIWPTGYSPPNQKPKVIRTSELEKRADKVSEQTEGIRKRAV